MRLFKTSGPGLWSTLHEAWISGGFKYFLHNLSCGLRHCRYAECWGYENTWYDRFLFSLGVFLIDPLGRYHDRHCRHDYWFRKRTGKARMSDTQWLRHPCSWVRRRARKHVDWLEAAHD